MEYLIKGYTPYQRCPLCEGLGKILADGFIATNYQTCPACKGERIIPMLKEQ